MPRTSSFTFSLVLTLLCLLLPSLARAQATIGMDPSAKRFSVKPGASVTQDVSLYNPNQTDKKLRVVAYLTDFAYNEAGREYYPNSGTLPESAGKWVTVSPAEVMLGGQERKTVRYTIQVPPNAKPGTHWAMLMFEGQDPNAKPGQGVIGFNVRIGHAIFVNVEPTKVDGDVGGIFDDPPAAGSDVYNLAVQYNNTGNTAVGVRGRVEVRDERGTLLQTAPLELTVALPGRSTFVRASVYGPLKQGRYSVLAVLGDGVTNRDIVGETVVNLPVDLVAPRGVSTGAPTTNAGGQSSSNQNGSNQGSASQGSANQGSASQNGAGTGAAAGRAP